jgi:hypothetical protein
MTASKPVRIAWECLTTVVRPPRGTAVTEVTCPRCAGFARAFERFGHVANGRCLRCAGALTIEIDAFTAWGWARDSARAADARARKAVGYRQGRAVSLPSLSGMAYVVRGARPGEYVLAHFRGAQAEADRDVWPDEACFAVRDGRVEVTYASDGIVDLYGQSVDTFADTSVQAWTDDAIDALRAELQAAYRG